MLIITSAGDIPTFPLASRSSEQEIPSGFGRNPFLLYLKASEWENNVLQEANHTECDGLAAHSSNFHTYLSKAGDTKKTDYYWIMMWLLL